MAPVRRSSSAFACSAVSLSTATAAKESSPEDWRGEVFFFGIGWQRVLRRKVRSAGADQAFGGGACLLGDLGAGEHAGDLLAAVAGAELAHLGGDALAGGALQHLPMVRAARGDLRAVGDDQDLAVARQPLEPLADRVRRGAADAAVD